MAPRWIERLYMKNFVHSLLPLQHFFFFTSYASIFLWTKSENVSLVVFGKYTSRWSLLYLYESPHRDLLHYYLAIEFHFCYTRRFHNACIYIAVSHTEASWATHRQQMPVKYLSTMTTLQESWYSVTQVGYGLLLRLCFCSFSIKEVNSYSIQKLWRNERDIF